MRELTKSEIEQFDLTGHIPVLQQWEKAPVLEHSKSNQALQNICVFEKPMRKRRDTKLRISQPA